MLYKNSAKTFKYDKCESEKLRFYDRVCNPEKCRFE